MFFLYQFRVFRELLIGEDKAYLMGLVALDGATGRLNSGQ